MTAASGRRFLMVEPEHFTVTYRINPWMTPTVDNGTARAQWKQLLDAVEAAGAEVCIAQDVPGLPDMAFPMNAGFAFGQQVVPSVFRHPERRGEEPHWRAWFEAHGFEVVDLGLEGVTFEAGDAFLAADRLIAAWGFRSDRTGLDRLAVVVGRQLEPLHLVDERFYHLDTCFCPLDERAAIIYPGAIAAGDRWRLLELLPDSILLSEGEALTLCANSLPVGQRFLTSCCPTRVGRELERRGYEVVPVDVSEFHKSGGSVRCMTLPLDLPGPGTSR